MHAALESLERRLCLSHWTYTVGQTFTGSVSREAVELLGQQRRVYVGCVFSRGTTCVRLNRCRWISFVGCRFSDPVGPADPDGSCAQTINCGNVTFDGCTFIAGPAASDLLSIYADGPESLGPEIVRNCRFYGAGRADFSTSICIDGPGEPLAVVEQVSIHWARNGVTVAGGLASLARITYVGCHVPVYCASLYHAPARVLTDQPQAVLVGTGGSVGAAL